MNYHKIYHGIIAKSQNRELHDVYTERHHILPRSLGGSDCKLNIAILTAREHFLCHYCLVKMQPAGSDSWHKMVRAFGMMKASACNQDRYFNSRLYESLRINFSKTASYNQAGTKNSNFGTRWIYNTLLKESKKIPINEPLPLGWLFGRILNWDTTTLYSKLHKCRQCDITFIRTSLTKFCSCECKSKNKQQSSSVSTHMDRLKSLSADYNVVMGSIEENISFIRFAMLNNISTYQILLFIGCTGSGTHYKTLAKLL